MASKLPDKGSKLPIVFGPVHSRNVGAVRLLVGRVLPVTYSDSFWSKLVQGTNALSVMGKAVNTDALVFERALSVAYKSAVFEYCFISQLIYLIFLLVPFARDSSGGLMAKIERTS